MAKQNLMQLKGQKGVNWVKKLPKYQQVLNEYPKEVLGYLTPFHNCDRRKSNFSQKTTEREQETFKPYNEYPPCSKDKKECWKCLLDIQIKLPAPQIAS